MVDTKQLVENINNVYRERLRVLATIEEIRQHHLVRDYAQFYLDKNGELQSRIVEDANLSDAAKLQVQGRINKIHSLIDSHNQKYKSIRNTIMKLSREKALCVLKECAMESVKLYDEVNDALLKDMKKYNAIDQNFQGKVDLTKLKNLPNSRKVTLTILQQYIDYEIDCYKKLEVETKKF